MNKKTQSSQSVQKTQTMLAIGAGVAALATASYYFFGPKGEEHRDRMKGWMIKMKGEIIEKIEDVKELTEPVYHDIVDTVVASYATTTKIGKDELHAFANRLKGQWREIVASTQEDGARTTKRIAKKTVKKTTRSSKK